MHVCFQKQNRLHHECIMFIHTYIVFLKMQRIASNCSTVPIKMINFYKNVVLDPEEAKIKAKIWSTKLCMCLSQ